MRKRKKRIPKKSILLLSAAVLLLLGSTIGSTRAALTYYSENYVAGMKLSSIGVSLLENGEVVSNRDYADNGAWEGKADGVLLDGFLQDGEKIIPGKNYDEVLSVRNSGNIDTYVRVIVTTNWLDKEGKPATNLDPSLIKLNYNYENGWVKDGAASTTERTVLYYQGILTSGSEATFAESLQIDPAICRKLTQTVNDNVYTYTYEYDGYSFQIAAEVDVVQTHNAADAIKSAWGVDASMVGL